MEFLEEKEENNKINNLINKLQNNKNEFKKVTVSNSSLNGNGIISLVDVSIGDILIEISFEDCISIDRILKSPLGIIFEENESILNYPDEVLCIGSFFFSLFPSIFDFLFFDILFYSLIFYSLNNILLIY